MTQPTNLDELLMHESKSKAKTNEEGAINRILNCLKKQIKSLETSCAHKNVENREIFVIPGLIVWMYEHCPAISER